MIQERIEQVKLLQQELLNHPMCLKIEEDKHYITVFFPNAVAGIDGVRHGLAGGKAKALKKLIEKCEEAWQADNPFIYPKKPT